MEMSPNSRAVTCRDVADRLRGARIDGNLIGYEVGGPHSQAIEKSRQRFECADIADGHSVTAAIPVVLLCVDRDETHGLARHNAFAATVRSPVRGPPDVVASNAAATARPITAAPPAAWWSWWPEWRAGACRT